MDDTSGVSCQPSYIRSVSGILKLIEFLCDLLAVILCGAAPTLDGGTGQKGFFLFVAILSLIITTTLLALCLLNIQNVILKSRWPLIEMIWCIFIALFYFIASIVIATIANRNGVYGAAAFFGFAAFITYVADAINQFRINRSISNDQHAQQYAPSMSPPSGLQPYPPNMAPSPVRQS